MFGHAESARRRCVASLRPLAWRLRLPLLALGLLLGEVGSRECFALAWRVVVAGLLATPLLLRRRRAAGLAAALCFAAAGAGVVLGVRNETRIGALLRESPAPAAQRVEGVVLTSASAP